MGTGCSSARIPPPLEIKDDEKSLTRKTSAHGFKVPRNEGTSKPPAPRPMSRVVGFVTARGPNTGGIDVGSRSSSAALRNNCFWSHEDDDRIDQLINRWKAAEILFLKVHAVNAHTYYNYLLTLHLS